VILIIADGLRADHMQTYGYGRPTTPHMQHLVATGAYEKFDNVHSFCAESNCATVTLLSSRDANRIPSEPFTFAQVLKQHGYAIHMVMGGDQTNYYNKRALFGKVDSYFDGSMAEGYYMGDDSFVLPKTRELPKWNGKPTMLQFHFMSPHIMGTRLPAYQMFKPSETYAGKVEGPPEQRHTNFYDNGVLQFDAFVQQVLATVRSKQYLDNAIVIITSDHGESLGDKGRYMHGWGVHQPLLHIPLLISGMKPRPPQVGGGQPFIAQSDIMPTILHELGMPLPQTWIGKPIHALQSRATNTDLVRFEMHDFAGVFDGRELGRRWKYAVNRHTKEEFVYDLAQDPQEKNNLLLLVPVALADEWRRHVPPELPQQAAGKPMR
jgi:arylsulfatase A-like enzyme